MKLIHCILLITFTFINLSSSLLSQELNTPKDVIWQHLENLQKSNFNPIKAGNCLNANGTDEEKSKLAVKLKKVLDANNLFIYENKLPNDPLYYDSTSMAHIYVPFESFPNIYVEKVDKRWLYSAETVDAIPQLYDNVSNWWQEQLMAIVPSSLRIEVIDELELWQLIGLIIISLLCYLIYKLLNIILAKYVLNKFKSDERSESLKSTIKDIITPLSLSIGLLLIIPLSNIIQLPIQIKHFLIIGVKVVVYINGIVVCYQLVDLIVYFISKYTSKTESTLDDQIVPLISKFMKVLVVIGGILFILQSLDVNITTLLAGLSIGGLAFAFAAQDTIKNLFGSIMIFIDRPFQIGDFVMIGGVSGVVEEVGFRSTRIRTLQSSLVSIPNGSLADQVVDNLGKRQFRRFNTKLGLTYDTPPHYIDAFVEGVREIVSSHPAVVEDSHEIHLESMGDFSLNILLHMKLSVSGWDKELQAKHEIYMTIIKLAYELGVSFAFPTQTLHMENFPDKKSLSPSYNKEINSESLERFLSDYKKNIKYTA